MSIGLDDHTRENVLVRTKQLLSGKTFVAGAYISDKPGDKWNPEAYRRPDFKVLTGNDLAIDMVIYGSDYLLGLSTFAPDAFSTP